MEIPCILWLIACACLYSNEGSVGFGLNVAHSDHNMPVLYTVQVFTAITKCTVPVHLRCVTTSQCLSFFLVFCAQHLNLEFWRKSKWKDFSRGCIYLIFIYFAQSTKYSDTSVYSENDIRMTLWSLIMSELSSERKWKYSHVDSSEILWLKGIECQGQ